MRERERERERGGGEEGRERVHALAERSNKSNQMRKGRTVELDMGRSWGGK